MGLAEVEDIQGAVTEHPNGREFKKKKKKTAEHRQGKQVKWHGHILWLLDSLLLASELAGGWASLHFVDVQRHQSLCLGTAHL